MTFSNRWHRCVASLSVGCFRKKLHRIWEGLACAKVRQMAAPSRADVGLSRPPNFSLTRESSCECSAQLIFVYKSVEVPCGYALIARCQQREPFEDAEVARNCVTFYSSHWIEWYESFWITSGTHSYCRSARVLPAPIVWSSWATTKFRPFYALWVSRRFCKKKCVLTCTMQK